MFGVYNDIDMSTFKKGTKLHIVNYKEDRSFYGVSEGVDFRNVPTLIISLRDSEKVLCITKPELMNEVYGINILLNAEW